MPVFAERLLHRAHALDLRMCEEQIAVIGWLAKMADSD
jgi:hypothetical protein